MLQAEPVLDHHDLILRPDPSRTVVRPFDLEYPGRFRVEGHPRAQAIVDRILTLRDGALESELELLTHSLDERHRDVDEMLRRRFDEIAKLLPGQIIEAD